MAFPSSTRTMLRFLFLCSCLFFLWVLLTNKNDGQPASQLQWQIDLLLLPLQSQLGCISNRNKSLFLSFSPCKFPGRSFGRPSPIYSMGLPYVPIRPGVVPRGSVWGGIYGSPISRVRPSSLEDNGENNDRTEPPLRTGTTVFQGAQRIDSRFLLGHPTA